MIKAPISGCFKDAPSFPISKTGLSYTDLTAQNGTKYFYAVSATLVGGQETINSGARSALPPLAQGIVGWNYDRYGTVSGTSVAGAVPAANWNNTYPTNRVANLADNRGGETTLDSHQRRGAQRAGPRRVFPSTRGHSPSAVSLPFFPSPCQNIP